MFKFTLHTRSVRILTHTSCRDLFHIVSEKMAALTLKTEVHQHGGVNRKYTHQSKTVNCEMTFTIFYPPQALKGTKCPALYWLSGLTCTDDNFSQKAGAQRAAAQLGLILVVPDTSPRGDDVANDEAYDLGQGAGFYVNATEVCWTFALCFLNCFCFVFKISSMLAEIRA